MSPPVLVRPAVPADFPFVFSAWEHSYLADVRRRIGQMTRDSQTLVACDPADEDVLLGFVCAAPPSLHYAYVKREMRRLGVARAMLTELGAPIESFTFRTDAGERRLRLTASRTA